MKKRRFVKSARVACPTLAALLLLASTGLAADRVVAVADIHGAYEEFVGILQAAGLLDKDLSWSGGQSVLIQTGDVIDRGPKSRQCLDLLMSLGEKAAQKGGEVRPLLGNHEVMVMLGDLRYVTPEDYASFAGPNSEELRQKELGDYVAYRRQRAAHLGQSGREVTAEEQKAWLAAHPPGYFELRNEYSPTGRYGKWLRSRDAVTEADDAIFVHGGLSADLPWHSVKEINEQVRREIAKMDDAWMRLSNKGVLWPYLNFDEARAEAKAETRLPDRRSDLSGLLDVFLSVQEMQIFSQTGPLWYRGYAQEDEGSLSSQLGRVLKRFKVSYMVTGHTVPQDRRITARFNNRVFLIDTGMLGSYFQGRASALEISAGGEIKSLYAGEDAKVLLAGHSAAKSQ